MKQLQFIVRKRNYRIAMMVFSRGAIYDERMVYEEPSYSDVQFFEVSSTLNSIKSIAQNIAIAVRDLDEDS